VNKAKRTPKLDSIGMTASMLCAVHCAVVPLLITTLPLFGLGFLANPLIEWGMIILALFIGIYAIGFSYVRVHHRRLPVILLISGFFIIMTGHLLVTGWREAIVVPMGGLLIVTAHFFNFRYTGICRNENSAFHLKHSHS